MFVCACVCQAELQWDLQVGLPGFKPSTLVRSRWHETVHTQQERQGQRYSVRGVWVCVRVCMCIDNSVTCWSCYRGIFMSLEVTFHLHLLRPRPRSCCSVQSLRGSGTVLTCQTQLRTKNDPLAGNGVAHTYTQTLYKHNDYMLIVRHCSDKLQNTHNHTLTLSHTGQGRVESLSVCHCTCTDTFTHTLSLTHTHTHTHTHTVSGQIILSNGCTLFTVSEIFHALKIKLPFSPL